MRYHRPFAGIAKPSLAMVLLVILLVALTFAGGASRGNVLGQVIVRAAAWALLIVAILFGPWPDIRSGRPVAILLAAAIFLAAVQLIPLPPAVWLQFPGRDLISQAAVAAGEPQPWRSWSITPSATMNTLFSLIVPATTLWLVLGLKKHEYSQLLGVMLSLVLIGALVGLIQVSGIGLDNPFINETRGRFSGTFANTNHFALQLAIGCLLAPAWLLRQSNLRPLSSLAGLASILFFVSGLLVGGSRAGLFLGGVALLLAFMLGVARFKEGAKAHRRWVFPVAATGIAAVIISLVMASLLAGRANSVDQLVDRDPGQDLRAQALPTLWKMIVDYFPLGSGFGSFDPAFRIHEPFSMLKPTYFNHAHNDFIEVVITAGIPGMVLTLAAMCWWAWESFGAWRGGSASQTALPKLGAAILLLIFLASAVDYPARSPTIMAWSVIAAVWLAGCSTGRNTREAGAGQTLAP